MRTKSWVLFLCWVCWQETGWSVPDLQCQWSSPHLSPPGPQKTVSVWGEGPEGPQYKHHSVHTNSQTVGASNTDNTSLINITGRTAGSPQSAWMFLIKYCCSTALSTGSKAALYSANYQSFIAPVEYLWFQKCEFFDRQ